MSFAVCLGFICPNILASSVFFFWLCSFLFGWLEVFRSQFRLFLCSCVQELPLPNCSDKVKIMERSAGMQKHSEFFMLELKGQVYLPKTSPHHNTSPTKFKTILFNLLPRYGSQNVKTTEIQLIIVSRPVFRILGLSRVRRVRQTERSHAGSGSVKKY